MMKNSIVIDFEGEGRPTDASESPKPLMLGIYGLRDTPGPRYTWVAFDDSWRPAVNGSHERAKCATLDETFDYLSDIASQSGGKLIHWSDHEKKILKEHLDPALCGKVLPTLLNARIQAKKYVRARGLTQTVVGLTLDDFYHVIFPNVRRPSHPPVGPAEACRRIDKACSNAKRWSRFSNANKNIVHGLIAYNKDDCLLTARILKRITNAGFAVNAPAEFEQATPEHPRDLNDRA